MIEYITYEKKKYPVRMGYSALKKFKRDTGKDFEKIKDEGDIEIYEPILLYSLQAGHKALKEKCPFKLEQMEDVLDECFFEFIQLIPKFFPEGLIMTDEGEVVEKKQEPNRQTRRKTARATKKK